MTKTGDIGTRMVAGFAHPCPLMNTPWQLPSTITNIFVKVAISFVIIAKVAITLVIIASNRLCHNYYLCTIFNIFFKDAIITLAIVIVLICNYHFQHFCRHSGTEWQATCNWQLIIVIENPKRSHQHVCPHDYYQCSIISTVTNSMNCVSKIHCCCLGGLVQSFFLSPNAVI